MATITIPRLVGKPNKSGRTSWYWQPSAANRREGWAMIALGTFDGADPPQDVIDAARARNAELDRGVAAAGVRRPPRVPTLGEGIDLYVKAGFPSVKKPGTCVGAGTQKQYKSKFKVLRAWGATISIRSIDADRVAVLRDALMTPVPIDAEAGDEAIVRHHHAHETLRVGRALFTWFEQQRMLPKGSNPFADFALAAPGPREHVWWPPAREAIMAVAEKEEDAACALAIDLAFQIGQREADLLKTLHSQYAAVPPWKMDPDVFATLAAVPVPAYRGRAFYVPGDVWGIRLRQSKTRRWIEVPIVGLTRARVEYAIELGKAAGRATILHDQRSGLPWTHPNEETGQTYFIRRFADLRTAAVAAASAAGDADLAAELEELQYRDFRRTAVVYLAELGIPDHLIAAITGHSLDETKKIIETYLPRTTGQAARAIALAQARAPAAPKEQQG